MEMQLIVRPFQGNDENQLIQMWNACLARDPITPSIFRTRVLLDPNFSPAGLLIAEIGNKLVGFILSITRQTPFFTQGFDPETGWITAFGVLPEFQRQGFGTRLMDVSLERLRGMGRKTVWISSYTPNYFIPGVDMDEYPAALDFLQKRGWQITSSPIAMQADLTQVDFREEFSRLENAFPNREISALPVSSADLPELLPFISENFGWDWRRHAQEYLLQLFGAGTDDINFLVARKNGKIVGYCQQRRERFGPFGVLPEMRGKGIGSLLLLRCLSEMYARGFHCAWFLWTGKHNQHIYARAGFKPFRQFAVMKLELKGNHI